MNKGVYICFDTECSGLDPTVNNLLTACFIVLNSDLTELDRLNLSVKHKKYTVNPEAMLVNKIDLKTHNSNAMPIVECKDKLIKFLGKYNRLIPIGHNINFDIAFLQTIISKEEYNIYFSYNSIDTISIAYFLKLANKLPDKQACSLVKLTNYFGDYNTENAHDCEKDTEMTIQLIKNFLKLIGKN